MIQRLEEHGQIFNADLNTQKHFIVKKIITILGSLFVFAGLKAQTVPTVKKETVKPVKANTTIVTDSTQKQLKITSIKETIPAIKKAFKTTNFKTTNPAIKLPMKEATKPVKG